MKKLVAVMGMSLLAGVAGGAFAADNASGKQAGFAVVNVQEIFQQSPRIAGLNKKLQDQFKPRQDKLLAAQKSLQDEIENFRKNSATMSKKEKDSLQKKIVSDQDSLSREQSAFQQDLNKEQKRILSGVLADLNNIISGIAKKHNYSMVLDSQAVVYTSDSPDLTKDVAKSFDAK